MTSQWVTDGRTSPNRIVSRWVESRVTGYSSLLQNCGKTGAEDQHEMGYDGVSGGSIHLSQYWLWNPEVSPIWIQLLILTNTESGESSEPLEASMCSYIKSEEGQLIQRLCVKCFTQCLEHSFVIKTNYLYSFFHILPFFYLCMDGPSSSKILFDSKTAIWANETSHTDTHT